LNAGTHHRGEWIDCKAGLDFEEGGVYSAIPDANRLPLWLKLFQGKVVLTQSTRLLELFVSSHFS
jgi:hypothetical protein